MIHVEVTTAGTCLLRADHRLDEKRLREAQYVLRRRGKWVTFWPYLVDLRRDSPQGALKWHPAAAGRLRALKARVDTMKVGDDHRVRRCFREDRQPYSFQMEAIHAGLNTKRILVADDTGLGKTIETMGMMLPLLREGLVKRAVLVVPAGLKHQWAEEIDEFAAVAPDPVLIAGGNPRRRRQLYNRNWRVLLINPELVRIDFEHLAAISNSVGFVALDEASCIRNEESQIAKCMKVLWKHADYRVALTATPVENCLNDLWSIIRWVSPKAFISRAYFESRYVVYKNRSFKVTKKNGREVRVTKREVDSYQHLREVESKIRHCYIRRRVSEVGMELPELVVSWDRLLLPKRQRDTYKAIKDKLEDKVKSLRGAALIAPLQALRQACNTTFLVEKDTGQKHCAVKIDRLRELLKTEFAGEQVIIFTDYERFGRVLARALRSYKPVLYTGKMTKRDRQRSIDSFRLGDRRILIGTKALERGHNLQNAAIVVNIDLPFNPASVLQRLGRIRRIGSKHHTVRLWNMVTVDTVEEKLIMKSLYQKRKVFDDIFVAGDGDGSRALFSGMDTMTGTDVVKLL